MNRKKNIYIALSGSSGKMGRSIKKIIKSDKSLVLSCCVSPVSGLETWENKPIDGVIDFSSPELFEIILKWCVKNKKPFVSGTTGLSNKQKQSLKIASKKIPVFYEENMSWGIWLIKNWISGFAHNSVNVEMEDIHHKNKKDKPSGTALKLKRSFPPFYQKKIKIKSIRKGSEFGTHRIYFKADKEVVLLEHKALNREIFAKGALSALRWLVFQKPKLYCLDDMYKILRK